jgi:hypothetical protein
MCELSEDDTTVTKLTKIASRLATNDSNTNPQADGRPNNPADPAGDSRLTAEVAGRATVLARTPHCGPLSPVDGTASRA